MSKSHTPQQFLSYNDIAKATGMSLRNLRRHVASGAIPGRRAGGRVLFRARDLDEWFESLPPAARAGDDLS